MNADSALVQSALRKTTRRLIPANEAFTSQSPCSQWRAASRLLLPSAYQALRS